MLMLVASTQVRAFTCFEPPFVAKFQDSPVIFVARITGAQLGDKDSYYETTVDFEALEVLKGKVDFDHLTTGPLGAGGTPFVIGGEYLVYATEEGRTWSCSDYRALRPAEIVTQPNAAKYELDALRVLASERFRNIRSPWIAYDLSARNDGAFCILKNALSFNGDVEGDAYPWGELLISDINWIDSSASVQKMQRSIASIRIRSGESVEGRTAELRIGEHRFTLPSGDSPNDKIRHFELAEDEVDLLLNLLEQRSSISIVIDHPEYGDISATTHTPDMTTALVDFKACIE